MKKIIALLLVVALFSSAQPPVAEPPVSVNGFSAPVAGIKYTWYYNSDFTDPVGSVNEAGNEVIRLSFQFPGVSFAGNYQIGYIEYQYGYFNSSITTIIYSSWWY